MNEQSLTYRIASAGSRLLNSFFGSQYVTFSADSWRLRIEGKTWGRIRVSFVDALPFNGKGHCENAYNWHVQNGLYDIH
jgi:hypothetical protein